MYKILLIVFLIISISLISLIMLKPGKNSDMGISIGTNSPMSFLSSSNNINIITRITSILAILFFIVSLILSNLNSKKMLEKNKWKNINISKKNQAQQTATINNDIPR